jgi:hypothetical protein
MTIAQFATLGTTYGEIAVDNALIARFGNSTVPVVGKAGSKALALLAASTRTRSDDRAT